MSPETIKSIHQSSTAERLCLSTKLHSFIRIKIQKSWPCSPARTKDLFVIGRSSDLSRPMRLPSLSKASGREYIGLLIRDLQQQALSRICTGFQIIPYGCPPSVTNDASKVMIKNISWCGLLITKKHIFERSFQQPLL